MTRLHPFFFLLLTASLCAMAQDGPPPGISFSPAAGAVEPGQAVTVTATGEWPTPPTIFCTTDGSPANIAATLVGAVGSGGGTITVLDDSGQQPASQTLNCVAVLGAVAYQNVNASDKGWKTCIGDLNYAANGSPKATCSGGVGSSHPQTWGYTWGSTMTQQMTGGDNVQILAPFSADVCPLCDEPAGTQVMMAQSKTVTATADASVISNNEMDMQAVDATNQVDGVAVEHNFGLQCEQSRPASHPGYWAIAGVGHWVSTTISDQCPWPANVPINVVAQGWWAVGDTGCGGKGCFHVLSLTVNGTVHDLSETVWAGGLPAGALAQSGRRGWGSFFGIQDQMDLAENGGTAGREVSNANVTEALYTPNPVTGSATYATSTTAALISPAPGSVLPSSSVTFSWTPATGATAYALSIGGNGRRTSRLFSSGQMNRTSVTVSGLPTDGSALYAQLWTLVDGGWTETEYAYTASTLTIAAITAPTPGSALSGPSATFMWTPATGATEYALILGSTGPGSNDIYNSNPIPATFVTVPNLPNNGETVYAELWSLVNGAWVTANYTYAGALPTPTANTVPKPGGRDARGRNGSGTTMAQEPR
jgi:hypothetical protein